MVSVVQFGDWMLFLGERRLEWRGQRVKLGSRALDLLAVLALRKGEVVAAAELMKRVWPESVVTDASLRLHIWELRKALSAVSPRCSRMILNVPGRGYLLADIPELPGGREIAIASRPVSVVRVSRPQGRIVGRESFVRQVLDLLAARSIVTIVASGGMGKTTVALEVSQAYEREGRHIQWVDLSSVDCDGSVAREVAHAVRVTHSGDHTAALVQWLRVRNELLLVLDCCERAVAGAAALSECLVRQLPELRVLATSREPLHAKGERVIRLPPLEMPQPGADDPNNCGPAVELFIERARDADLPIRLPHDLPLISKICHALDGMPLAIELAAAHLVGLGIGDLASAIASGFQLGNLGQRTALERHRTLEATFEWSYRLLADADRQILEWLAVFEGGASLQAILEVLAGTGLDPTDISHGLSRLVDKSLVKLVFHEAGSFYRLLDTARAFAARRLNDRGEVLAARRSHAQHLLQAVSASQVEGQPSWAVEWFGLRSPNLANLRGALAWACSEPAVRSLAVALSTASAPTFLQLSLLEECKSNCERALGLLPDLEDVHCEEATKLMAFRGGSMLGTRGPTNETLYTLTSALAQAEQAQDGASRALVLSGLFWLWIYRSEPMEAKRAAVALHALNAGDTASALLRDNALAYASTLIGDQGDALARLTDVQRRNLRVFHGRFMRIGSDPNVFNRVFMVKTHWLRGEINQARELYLRHRPVLQRPEHGLYYCWALNEVVIPMHCFLSEWPAARAAADELADAATRQTMSVRQHAAACASMAVDLLQQRGDLDAYLESLEGLRVRHFAALLPWFDGVAAQAAFAGGRISMANQIIDRAIERSDRTSSRWWLSELHRIRGRQLIESGDAGDQRRGQQDFRIACEIAQSQHAAALCLAAAVAWGSSMPRRLDVEVRTHLQRATSSAPEMAHHALSEQARQLLTSAAGAVGVPPVDSRQ